MVMGRSNPGAVNWMDIWFIFSNCNNVCLKRPKINEKVAWVGPFRKNIGLCLMFVLYFADDQSVKRFRAVIT